MKWRIALVVTVLAAAGLTASVALGAWTGAQTASGTVSATTASPDLYLCEPEETGVGCGPDDSGADEIIFEGPEDLLPASAASSKLRLRNVGSNALDVLAAVPAVTEVADPGADCDLAPDVVIGLLGTVPYEWRATHNDNHIVDSYWLPDRVGHIAAGLQLFWGAFEDPRYQGHPGHEAYGVHIEPGEYEDFLIHVLLPATAPDSCEETVWDVSIAWEVVSVSHGRGN